MGFAFPFFLPSPLIYTTFTPLTSEFHIFILNVLLY